MVFNFFSKTNRKFLVEFICHIACVNYHNLQHFYWFIIEFMTFKILSMSNIILSGRCYIIHNENVEFCTIFHVISNQKWTTSLNFMFIYSNEKIRESERERAVNSETRVHAKLSICWLFIFNSMCACNSFIFHA